MPLYITHICKKRNKEQLSWLNKGILTSTEVYYDKGIVHIWSLISQKTTISLIAQGE